MDTEKYFVREMKMFKDLDELLAVIREEEKAKQSQWTIVSPLVVDKNLV